MSRPRTYPSARTGVVSSFDAAVGLGAVTSDDGVELGFHCTQITGGGRLIEVGAVVAFAVVPGHQGRWQAAQLRPAP